MRAMDKKKAMEIALDCCLAYAEAGDMQAARALRVLKPVPKPLCRCGHTRDLHLSSASGARCNLIQCECRRYRAVKP